MRTAKLQDDINDLHRLALLGVFQSFPLIREQQDDCNDSVFLPLTVIQRQCLLVPVDLRSHADHGSNPTTPCSQRPSIYWRGSDRSLIVNDLDQNINY